MVISWLENLNVWTVGRRMDHTLENRDVHLTHRHPGWTAWGSNATLTRSRSTSGLRESHRQGSRITSRAPGFETKRALIARALIHFTPPRIRDSRPLRVGATAVAVGSSPCMWPRSSRPAGLAIGLPATARRSQARSRAGATPSDPPLTRHALGNDRTFPGGNPGRDSLVREPSYVRRFAPAPA
jgi:hypothetical protein